MLECLALEDSCIEFLLHWFSESIGISGFIGTLSLIVSINALGKSRKSNKMTAKSLELARDSIQTSIGLFERQQSIDASKISDANKRKEEALLTAITTKASIQCQQISEICKLVLFVIDNNINSITFKYIDGFPIMMIKGDNSACSRFKFLIEDGRISENILIQSAELSKKLATKAIRVNNGAVHTRIILNFIIDYAENNQIELLTELLCVRNEKNKLSLIVSLGEIFQSIYRLKPHIEKYPVFPETMELLKRLDHM